MIALLMLQNVAIRQPYKAMAACFVLATFLNLLGRCVLASAKDQVLTRAGNPRVNFAVILFYNLLSAAVSAKLIELWFAERKITLTQSISDVISFTYLRQATAPYGLDIQSLADNLGNLSRIVEVPVHVGLLALLNVLIYLAFLRSALEVFALKREQQHYAALGMSLFALDRLDEASENLQKAKMLPQVQMWLLAIALKKGRFKEMSGLGRRLCGSLGIDYRPEEELLASIALGGVNAIPRTRVVEYARSRHTEFADPRIFPILIVLPLLEGPVEEGHLDELKGFLPVPAGDLCFALQEDRKSNALDVRRYVLSINPRSALLIAATTYLSCSTLIDDEPTQAVQATALEVEDERALKSDSGQEGSVDANHEQHESELVPSPTSVLSDRAIIERLQESLGEFTCTKAALLSNWEAFLLLLTLPMSRTMYHVVVGDTSPEIEELLVVAREALKQNDIVGSMIDMAGQIESEESKAFVENLRT